MQQNQRFKDSLKSPWPHGSIYEEMRRLVFLEEADFFFPEDEPDLIYSSHFKSVRGYRAFLKKQLIFEEHASFLKKYAVLMHTEPKWNRLDDMGDLPF